jgi:2-polyprenyl-6-methoxyphenol hydroxylase-like FAD-dependent oxidoreductase
MPQQHHQAIIIGGSLSGLLSARVLSGHFNRVLIVDRDQLPVTPEPRRGVPQSVQPHVLFSKGYRILEDLFPGIGKTIEAGGAIRFDWGKEFQLFQKGHWAPTTATATGIESYTCTRPLLESSIRQRVSQLPNVEFLTGQRVVGLMGNQTSIHGIKFRDGAEYSAQLVVDASGRSTQAPQWLKNIGCTPPTATVIDPQLGYATRRYRIPSKFQPAGKILLISQEPPDQPRLGYLAAVEQQEWIATLGGYGRDYPPIEEQGFLKFAQSLSDPTFYEAIAQAEPCSEIRAHRATANRLYHYEKIDLPNGLIAIGDSVCSLCPVYGQGMTVSAMSAVLLSRWLVEPSTAQAKVLNGGKFQKQLAQSNAFPWSLATGLDSKFPTTKGAIATSWAGNLFQKYGDRLAALAEKDRDVHLQLLEMAHMIKPPSSLLSPRLILRALF